jgi:membrane protein
MAVAATHGEIASPARPGPIGFVKEFYGRFSNDRVLAISAGVTFYVLLAIFPAIAACVSLFGLFENFGQASADLSHLSAILPGGAIQIVSDQVRRTIAKGHDTLGYAALFGFLLSLWSANSGVLSLFDALNIVRRQSEKRGLVRLYGTALLFTLGLLIAAGAAATLMIWVSSWLHLDSPYLLWPAVGVGLLLLWAALAFGIALLYRFGPTGNDIPWRWLTWGSTMAALAWLGFSAAFSWYAANFGSFDQTYGSLGAAVGFMIWIWLSTVVVLCGEEINEIVECQKKGQAPPPHPLPKKTRA